MIYSNWSEVYEESVYKLSFDTWFKGIFSEIERIRIFNGSILDAGCGTGIGYDALKNIGKFSFFGIDISNEMLNKSKGKYENLTCTDIAEFDISEKVDIIVSGFGTLNYLNNYQLHSFFLSASNVLKNDGYIIFDYNSPKYLEFDRKSNQYEQILSNSILKWDYHYDDIMKCSKLRLSNYVNNEKCWEENHAHFSYSTHDIYKIACDFNIIKVRNLNSDTFTPNANTHVYLLKKNN